MQANMVLNRIDFSDSKFDALRCKFDPDDSHIFNDARKLPCGSIGCVECIRKKFDAGLHCICDDVHDNCVVDDLPKNDDITKQINENAVQITEEIIVKLLDFSEKNKGTFLI
jgi:hypothetical protein